MVSYYTGYIQVHLKGYWDHQVLDNSMERNQAFETKATDLQNIDAIAPRIESYALASFGDMTKGCMVVGISPEHENRITGLRDKIVDGKYFTQTGTHTVILSAGLALRSKLDIADTLYLIGQGYHGALAAGKYTIQGIVTFGSPELNDQLLFMPLETAQEFYSAPNMITSYVVGLRSDKLLGETVGTLKQHAGPEFEVMSWKEMLPDVDQHITMDKGSMFIITAVLYLLISLGIFGTLLMLMVERKYEMGMLVAIGMKKSKLAALFLTESVLTVFLGLLSGLIVSIPIVLYLNRYPIRIGGEMAQAYKQFNFEPIFPASVSPSIFITQGAIVLLIGLALSLYPVIKALRVNPVKAMKK
jgi:ABC-type lipoprotein release transport system permease subunit